MRKRKTPPTAKTEALTTVESKPTLENIAAALDDVGVAGDAARLQIHLLSMRARERTSELATRVESLERRLGRGLEEAMRTAASKARHLSSSVRELLGQSPAEDEASSVKAIMAEKVASCSPYESVNAAAQQMWERDCGALPVVADEELVGIITDRDICMAAFTKGRSLHAIRVEEVMARHVHTCGPDASLARAATLMAEAQVRRLPVVDEAHRLLGIVSLADLACSASVLGRSEGAGLVYELVRAISRRQHAPIERQLSAAQ